MQRREWEGYWKEKAAIIPLLVIIIITSRSSSSLISPPLLPPLLAVKGTVKDLVQGRMKWNPSLNIMVAAYGATFVTGIYSTS